MHKDTKQLLSSYLETELSCTLSPTVIIHGKTNNLTLNLLEFVASIRAERKIFSFTKIGFTFNKLCTHLRSYNVSYDCFAARFLNVNSQKVIFGSTQARCCVP